MTTMGLQQGEKKGRKLAHGSAQDHECVLFGSSSILKNWKSLTIFKGQENSDFS